MKLGIILSAIIGIIILAIAIGALFAFPVMWLWNGCLVGTVDGIHPITSFWQAFGIMVLFSLLFKSSSGKSS
jgi:hypothetical protein